MARFYIITAEFLVQPYAAPWIDVSGITRLAGFVKIRACRGGAGAC